LLESVKTDFTFIKTNFFIFVKIIKKLRSSNLSLFDTTKIVNETILNMEIVSGNNGRIIKEKVSDLIPKNSGFKILKHISDVLSGKKKVSYHQILHP
jgi:flagellar motor component MotA